MDNGSTIVELLQHRAFSQSQKMAFTFLENGETQETRVTYQELDSRSRQIAAQLQALRLNVTKIRAIA